MFNKYFSLAPIKGKYSMKYHKDPRNLTILISTVIHCVAIQKLFSIKHTAWILSVQGSILPVSQIPNSDLAQIVYFQSNYLTKKKFKNPLVHDYLSKFIITEKTQSHYLFIKVIGKHFNRKINKLLGNAGLC